MKFFVIIPKQDGKEEQSEHLTRWWDTESKALLVDRRNRE